MTLQEQRDVIQAAIDGKPVEYRCAGEGVWAPILNPASAVFDFIRCDYRVKPQPREWWLIRDGRGGWVAYPTITAGVSKQIHVREVLDE